MREEIKRYWEIVKQALLQEKNNENSKIKEMNLHEKEFLPAVLEVTEMPPSHAARLLTYVIIIMFAVLIIWSILGKIDIIATATGKLMPASNIKTIQTLTDSEIEEIYVQEGQYVKAGDKLIKFNQTEVQANINRVQNEMKALEIAVARLKALLSENPKENFIYNVQLKKMAETEENIEYLKKEMRQYLAEFDMKLTQELTQAREKLASYQQELVKYDEALKRTIIKAPLSGYVQQLVYHTQGGVVETAKPIMNIVPEDYKLEAEVMILNKDIGFVRPDQEVEIKVDSFPFTKYGTIKGIVRNISGDAVQDEKLGLVYPSRLTLLDNKISADGLIVQLKPGMGVTAEIKTGKRRVIEYLLSPVMKYLNESMKER